MAIRANSKKDHEVSIEENPMFEVDPIFETFYDNLLFLLARSKHNLKQKTELHFYIQRIKNQFIDSRIFARRIKTSSDLLCLCEILFRDPMLYQPITRAIKNCRRLPTSITNAILSLCDKIVAAGFKKGFPSKELQEKYFEDKLYDLLRNISTILTLSKGFILYTTDEEYKEALEHLEKVKAPSAQEMEIILQKFHDDQPKQRIHVLRMAAYLFENPSQIQNLKIAIKTSRLPRKTRNVLGCHFQEISKLAEQLDEMKKIVLEKK